MNSKHILWPIFVDQSLHGTPAPALHWITTSPTLAAPIGVKQAFFIGELTLVMRVAILNFVRGVLMTSNPQLIP